jgi:hypothetical protein
VLVAVLAIVLIGVLGGGGSKAKAIATPVALGPVLLQDTMANPATGVLETSSNDPQNTFKGYRNGHYVIKIVNPSFNLIATEYLSRLNNQVNTTMAIDARIVGATAGRTVDLACRSVTVGTDDRAYRLYVHPDTGMYKLVAFYSHHDHILTPLTPFSAINRGTSWNHLELSCIGNQISGAINGKQIPARTDTTMQKGELWIGTEVDPGPDVGEAQFRNLVVFQRKGPIPSSNPAALGPILLQDKLNSAVAGTLEKASNHPKDTFYGYLNGHYVISIVNPKYNFVANELLSPLATQTDTTMDIDARIVGPTSGRTIDLACRSTLLNHHEAEYRLYVHPDTGNYRLVLFSNSRNTSLIPETSTSAINTGNAWNHLELTCKGNQISGAINGKPIPARTDSTLQKGELWFGVEDDPGPDVVQGQFQNLVVYKR